MADIFRAPLFAKHHRRPEPPPQWSVPNLLTSTLAVAAAALPFNNASAFPTQIQHPSHARSANADTSRGIPKTLTADATVPVFNAPHFAPQHRSQTKFLNDDTSTGTPKTLFADATVPVFNAPVFARQHPRERHWLNGDTTDGTPLTLFPVVVAAPFINAPSLLVDGKRREDVRADIAPNLTLELPPDMIASGIPETLAIYRQPVRPADTSFRASVALDPFVPVPFVNTAFWSPPRVRWLPADTSASMPKAFIADAVVPLVNAPTLRVDVRRSVVDTSQGSPRQLLDAVVVPPFVVQPILSVHRRPPVADTSQSSPPGLLDIVAPPIVNVPFVTPDRVRAVTDTSRGMPKTLYADATVPFFNPPFLTADRVRPVRDTSQALNVALANFIPPAPFAQTDWPAPIRRPAVYAVGWGYGLNPNLYPVVTVTVVLSAPPTGHRTQTTRRPQQTTNRRPPNLSKRTR